MPAVQDQDGPDRLIPARFAAAMDQCLAGPLPKALAVGCSGGPDSMALTHLLREWCRGSGIELTAVVVDHGLRTDSAQEAQRVAEWLADRGVRSVVLTWHGRRPERNVQAEARRIRYTLLTEWCVDNAVDALAVAHHRDDQAETFLLRLARGSGVDGLSAMPRSASLQPAIGGGRVNLIRPLLDIGKDALHAHLTACGWPSVDDPSNRDPVHARVRMRSLTEELAREGLDPERLAKTARQMRRVRDALEAATERFLTGSARIDALGFIAIDREALRAEPLEISLRVLSRAVMQGGDEGPIPSDWIGLKRAGTHCLTPKPTRMGEPPERSADAAWPCEVARSSSAGRLPRSATARGQART